MRIPEYQVHQKEFYNIKTCFRSYYIEDDATKECPQSSKHKICSECAQLGHTWRECNSEVKECLNCDGNHRTISMKCTKKKDAIKKEKPKWKNKII